MYIARDNDTDEVVAIKIVSLDQNSKQLGLIVKEIEALATLEHRNIINYRGSYRLHHSLWIVMDYLEGKYLLVCVGKFYKQFYKSMLMESSNSRDLQKICSEFVRYVYYVDK